MMTAVFAPPLKHRKTAAALFRAGIILHFIISPVFVALPEIQQAYNDQANYIGQRRKLAIEYLACIRKLYWLVFAQEDLA